MPTRNNPSHIIREEPAVTRATATNNKWRRRSRQEWETVIVRFAESGLGVEAFCAREVGDDQLG